MHPHKLNNLDILGVPQHKYAKEAGYAHVFFCCYYLPCGCDGFCAFLCVLGRWVKKKRERKAQKKREKTEPASARMGCGTPK